MYASDSRAVSGTPVDGAAVPGPQHVAEEESGPAVEVIELANGETIWSVVDLLCIQCL